MNINSQGNIKIQENLSFQNLILTFKISKTKISKNIEVQVFMFEICLKKPII